MRIPSPRRRTVAALAVAGAALLGFGAPGTTATMAPPTPSWAPVEQATIHPGVQTLTSTGQCTANFVFYDANDVYIGQAAHCTGTGASTMVDGCSSGTVDPGAPVEIQGASQPGTLVYSSWATMQATQESDAETCMFNDFALVRVHPDDRGRVNPSLPHWGGPAGLADQLTTGETVYGYGNSSLRQGIEILNPKQGTVITTSPGGWNAVVMNVTPGLPGDSGSPVLDADGNAAGVLTTLNVLPLTGTNGLVSLPLALEYLNANTDLDVVLAEGTESFQPGLPLLGFLLG